MEKPLQILIVEDEVIVAVAIEEALLQAGFGVRGIAHTYQEAIRMTERGGVQAAIVDVGLGNELDGVATARAILRHQWMPLIYLTGSNDDATFERAKATNPYAFLNKPLRTQELVQQVQLAVHNFGQGSSVLDNPTEQAVYLPTNQGYARVDQAEIYYLEAAKNFTTIYLTDEALRRIMPPNRLGQPIMLTGNLGHWGKHLSPRLFHRLSKSLLININRVDRIETHQVVMGNCTISVPDKTRRALLDRLNIVRTR